MVSPANLATLMIPRGPPLAAGMGDCDGLTEPSFKTTVAGPGRRTYKVGVSSWSHIFLDDGVVDSADMPTPGGTYQLVISGVTTPTPPAPPPPPAAPACRAAACRAAACQGRVNRNQALAPG